MKRRTPSPVPGSAEALFARALLVVEPEKIEGGSPPRRAWLGLVMDVECYLYAQGFDVKAFCRALLDEAEL